MLWANVFMENYDQQQSENNFEEKTAGSGRFRKYIVRTLAVLFFGAILIYVAAWVVQYREAKKLDDIVATWEEYDKEYYRLASEDKYGGKTPQETLRMFIDAVEVENYELASKYFVFEKQEEWNQNLVDIDTNNAMENFLPPLGVAMYNRVDCSDDGDACSIYNPVGVDFVKYPSDVWKISDI